MLNLGLRAWGGKAGRTVLATSLLVTAAFWGWRQVGTSLESLEIYTRDRMVRLNANAPPDPRLLVVGVTESDIQRYRLPLPDGVVAEALSRIAEAQPRAVGLDIIRDLPQGEGQEQLLQVLQQHPQIVVVCKVGTEAEAGYPPPPGLPKARWGVSNLPVDPGGGVRRGLLGVMPPALPDAAPNPCQDPTAPMFSLGFQLARQYLAEAGIPLTFTDYDEFQLGEVVLPPLGPRDGGYQRADDGGYQILLQYRSGDRIAEQVTLSQLLGGQVSADQLRDRIVLVGYVAESAKDLFATPYSGGQNNNRLMPGVVIHAQLTSQILRTVLDGEPQPWFWPQGAELLWVWAWALVGGAIASALRHPLALGAAIGGAIGLCAGVGYLAFLQGGWVLVATPILALGLTAAGVILIDRNGQAIAESVQKVKKIVLRLNIDPEEAKREADKLLEGHEDLINVKSAKKGTPKRRSATPQPPDLPPDHDTNDRQPGDGEASHAPEIDPEADDLADFLNQIQRPDDQPPDQSQG
jgi:adenylate cyclase